jgi:hypothetical protein
VGGSLGGNHLGETGWDRVGVPYRESLSSISILIADNI